MTYPLFFTAYIYVDHDGSVAPQKLPALFVLPFPLLDAVSYHPSAGHSAYQILIVISSE